MPRRRSPRPRTLQKKSARIRPTRSATREPFVLPRVCWDPSRGLVHSHIVLSRRSSSAGVAAHSTSRVSLAASSCRDPQLRAWCALARASSRAALRGRASSILLGWGGRRKRRRPSLAASSATWGGWRTSWRSRACAATSPPVCACLGSIPALTNRNLPDTRPGAARRGA